jgi:hypothetical protein
MRELNRVAIDQRRGATDSSRQASAAELVYNANWVIDALNYSVDGGTLVRDSIIDDLSREPPIATIGSNWQLLTDQVMGGVSKGTLVRAAVAGRPAIRMLGDVSLENNGGFIQIALDLSPDGGVVDASAWGGIELDVFGNGGEYGVHLRTDALTRPWQSYRQSFTADAEWRTAQLPFDRFVPHRTDVLLDTHRLRRIGVVAIGRAFSCDLALGGLRFMISPWSVKEPSS